jgi:hypothetical protein
MNGWEALEDKIKRYLSLDEVCRQKEIHELSRYELEFQPRRKRSIVLIDPPICIPSTPPFVDSEAVRQGIRTRGGWVSSESPVFLEPRRAQIES